MATALRVELDEPSTELCSLRWCPDSLLQCVTRVIMSYFEVLRVKSESL